MRLSILPFLALPLAACLNSQPPKPWALPPEPDESQTPGVVARPTSSTDRAPFVVHEWGTYTSLQGSDGRVLPGMHYEEESLPAFVYGRVPPPPPGTPPNKQMEDLLLDGITQKLETPVIYFYGAPSHVDVNVEFPRGVISQWYPNAASFAPEVYSAQFNADEVMNGRMSWSLDVLGYGVTDGIIDVPDDDVWAPSRNVDAQTVRVGDEVEKFVFYRGLGQFETPFRVTSNGANLQLHNESQQRVPDVWILHWDGEKGAVWELGPLDAEQSHSFSPTPKELPQPEYLEVARQSVADGLIRSGLTEDESWAMVDTWNRSYFKSTGMRVLYVAPRVWTDELLPITVSPEPDELVRTLVGRVEVLTQSDEERLLAQLRSGEWDHTKIGRFAEPRLQRALQLLHEDDQVLRTQVLAMIAQTRSAAVSAAE